MPPDYDKLPLPDSKKVDERSKTIESILSTSESSEKRKKSPLETSIEKELRKGN